MLGADCPDDDIALLQNIFGTEEHDLGFPKRLRFDEIDSVFYPIASALLGIELELHNDYERF